MSYRFLVLPAFLNAAVLIACGCQSQPGPPATIVAQAQPPAPRSIAVTGTAEIKTAPDEFVISVGADSFAVEATAAKDANDRVMSALLAVTRAAGVDAKDVRTESFRLEPHFEGPYDGRRLTGYDAKKTLIVVVHDPDKLEALLAELFKSGANRLDGISYGSTVLADRRKEARLNAMAAAKEKAEAMAASLGQKVGRPLKIEETPEPGWDWLRPVNPLTNVLSNDNATRAVVSDTMATGKIRVQASVAVTFELTD